MDDFHRCVYPLYSEASNFTSNLNIIETNTNFQVNKIIGNTIFLIKVITSRLVWTKGCFLKTRRIMLWFVSELLRMMSALRMIIWT